jgi:hypothetical protein
MEERHIPDVLATGHFCEASFLKGNDGRYRIVYFARNSDDLDQYLRDNANGLRADFALHFPECVTVDREVWTVKQTWERELAIGRNELG